MTTMGAPTHGGESESIVATILKANLETLGEGAGRAEHVEHGGLRLGGREAT